MLLPCFYYLQSIYIVNIQKSYYLFHKIRLAIQQYTLEPGGYIAYDHVLQKTKVHSHTASLKYFYEKTENQLHLKHS